MSSSQLEPRVLAALSDDRRLAEVAAESDLYASLAKDSFDDERGRAKIAMLSAMYGGTTGEAGPLLAILRRRSAAEGAWGLFPRARSMPRLAPGAVV